MKVTSLPTDPGSAAWDAILPPAQRYPTLETETSADWLVIGAGFAGLAAARRLRQLHPTDTLVLLDARKIAEGPVGRNSGFMIDLPHNLVSDDYAGALEKDQAEAGENRAAIRFALDAAQEFEFSDETIVQSGKINAAATDKGSDYYQSGLFTPGTAMLQPARYAREMAAGLALQGVEVFESSPVIHLTREGKSWTAKTPGGSVQTPKVILTVNGHLESFGFFRRRLMHIFLYGSMTRALTTEEEKSLGGEATWGFTPADPMGTTVADPVSSFEMGLHGHHPAKSMRPHWARFGKPTTDPSPLVSRCWPTSHKNTGGVDCFASAETAPVPSVKLNPD